MADDFSSNSSTTGQIAIGGSSSGNFESSYDSDWFKVTLTAGTTYLFALQGEGASAVSNFSGVQFSLISPEGYSLSYGSGNATQGPVLQYTAQTSGAYYLAATSNYGQTGTYRIKSSLPAADDYAADTTTIATIAAGQTAAGVFERINDVDWFRFHADAGQITTFTATGSDGVAAPSSFNIYDSTGRSVSSVQAQSGFIAGLGGDYFVAVSANAQIGNYAIGMNVVTDDYTADNTHPGTLSAGGQAAGKIEYRDDIDRFKLAVTAGQFYTVTLTTALGDTQLLSLGITDGVGGYVTSSSNFSNGTLTLRVLATGTGTYSLNVAGAGSYVNNATGTAYTLKASAPEADDFGGTMGTAGLMTFGVAVKGKTQSPDDVDMFKVSLAAGVTYRIESALDDGSTNYGFRMTDSSGSSVGQSLYSSQKFFTFTPTKGGDFYLSQSGSYSNNAGNQSYTMSVSTAVDDYSANTATKGRLAVGFSAKGEMEAGGGDADWYAVALDAGGYYWFSLDGARENGGTLAGSGSTILRLIDASGAVLASSSYSYSGSAGVLAYSATSKGTYYVEVASPGSGTYTVKAQVGVADDHGDDAAHATPISTGAPVKGRLELTTDKDVFKITAEAGVTYQLQLSPGAEGGFNVNAYASLEVTTDNNEYVYTRYVSSINQLSRLFDASKSGVYYVKVGISAYASPGTYVLSATSLGKDDFPATKLTTAVVEPDKPLQGNIGVIDDRDWVKVHLDAGRTYVFDLQGAQSGGGTLDTAAGAGMTLYNSNSSNSTLTYTDTTLSGEPRMYYVARTSGDYYLEVHGSGSNTGTYSVVATVTNGDASAPHLLSSSLQDGAVGISPIMPKLVLTFDELVMIDGSPTLTDGNGTAVTPTGYGQQLLTVIGKTVVMDPHLNLKPGVTYTLSLPEGSVLDLAGNKVAGALTYKFTVAQPVTVGTSGNDFLLGASSGLKLDGGAGLDTVYMGGTSNYIQVTHNTDGSYTVYDYTKGSDTLTGVERVLFSNDAIALDIDGTGGQAYRLYQAAFNRTPDNAGVGYWIAAMDKGTSLATVADGFVRSQEFLNLYGSASSDADFVNLLYKNALHRDADAAGTSYWVDHLAHDTTRAQALAFFSESKENIEAAAKIIGNGFHYTPFG